MKQAYFPFYEEYLLKGKRPHIGEGHDRNNDRFKKEFDQAVENLKKATDIYQWYREEAIANLPEASNTNVFEIAGLEFLLIEAKKLSISRIKKWFDQVRFLKYYGTDEIVEVNDTIRKVIVDDLFKAATTYFRRK